MSMTPLGPKQLAQEFGTPGAAMSVDPTPEKVQDDCWGDGSWHRGWDAVWCPVSWNGWWAEWHDEDSWSAASWQSSSTDTSRRQWQDKNIHRMTSHLRSSSEVSKTSGDSLEALLEKAYESYEDEDGGNVSGRGSLKSLDSATTLELGSVSRESLEEEVQDTLLDKGIEPDDGSAEKLPKITVQEDRQGQSTVQEGEKQVPQSPVQEAEKQVPQSTVQELEKQVPQSTVQEPEKPAVPQSTVQEPEKQVPQSTVQEPEKQVPQSSPVQEPEKQVPQSSPVQQEPEKQVPQSSPVLEAEKQVPQSSPVLEAQKQVPQSSPVQEAQKQVPQSSPGQVQPQSGADTAAGGGQMVKQEPECDDGWRRDKYGKMLSPAALYARFYRTGRSLFLSNASFGIKGLRFDSFKM